MKKILNFILKKDTNPPKGFEKKRNKKSYQIHKNCSKTIFTKFLKM